MVNLYIVTTKHLVEIQSQKSKSCYDANFAVTDGTGGCPSGANSDEKVGIMFSQTETYTAETTHGEWVMFLCTKRSTLLRANINHWYSNTWMTVNMYTR